MPAAKEARLRRTVVGVSKPPIVSSQVIENLGSYNGMFITHCHPKTFEQEHFIDLQHGQSLIRVIIHSSIIDLTTENRQKPGDISGLYLVRSWTIHEFDF